MAWNDERAGDALLDAVDDGQLGVALLDLLGLTRGGEPRGVGDGRLLGERRDQVALGGVEPARRAVDVDVEGTDQHAPVEQRRDDARALRDLRRALRAVAQTRATGAPRLVDPGRDRRAQLGGVFAGGQLRGGDGETFGAVEQEQDPARPCQRGDALDELPVPRQVGCAAVVMPLGRGGGVAPIGAGTRCAASRRGGRWALPRPAPHAPRLLALRTRHDCSSPRRRDRAPPDEGAAAVYRRTDAPSAGRGTDGAGVRRAELAGSGSDRLRRRRASVVGPPFGRRTRSTARRSVR